MNTKSSSLRRVVMASLMILFVSLFAGQITAGAKQDKGNQQNHTQGKTDKSGKNNKKDWDNQDFKALDKAVDKAADQIFDPGISVSFARNLALEHNLTGYQALPPEFRKTCSSANRFLPELRKRWFPAQC